MTASDVRILSSDPYNMTLIGKGAPTNGYTPIRYQPWTAGKTYAVNDMISYSGTVYKCSSAHTAGTTFDSSKFTAQSTLSPTCAYKERQMPNSDGKILNDFTIMYMNESDGSLYVLSMPVSDVYSWNEW